MRGAGGALDRSVGGVDTSSYSPLDADVYRHQERLLRSLHCARPVKFHDKECFIHTLSLSVAGGHVEMTVYLTGDSTPIDSGKVEVAKSAQ